MSLAHARPHGTQSTAVASYQAESVPLPVTVTRPNGKTMIGATGSWCVGGGGGLFDRIKLQLRIK